MDWSHRDNMSLVFLRAPVLGFQNKTVILKPNARPTLGHRSIAACLALLLLFLPASPLLGALTAPSASDETMLCCKDPVSCPMHHSHGNGPSVKPLPNCCQQYGRASGVSRWVEVLILPPVSGSAPLSRLGELVDQYSVEPAAFEISANLYQRPPPFSFIS